MRDDTLAMGEPAPAPRPDNSPGAGLALGYVRLVPPRNAIDLVCRLCGRDIGSEVWAEAVSDGRGGLCLTGPICYACTTRDGESRATEPERARRLADLIARLAELRRRRLPAGGPAAEPRPRSRLSIRRKRPAAPAAEPAEEEPGRSGG
jgi:hypothetical protein